MTHICIRKMSVTLVGLSGDTLVFLLIGYKSGLVMALK